MNTQEKEESLWCDYLELCEKYDGVFPLHEFGYNIIRFATKMLVDAHANGIVSMCTALCGIMEGAKMQLEETDEKQEVTE